MQFLISALPAGLASRYMAKLDFVMVCADEKQLFTWKMLVGFALAMTGFGLYTQAKVVKMQLQTIPSESSDLPDHAAYSQLDSEMTSLEGPANTVHTTDDHQHEHN